MNSNDRAWAAGLFEGEGCISFVRDHSVYLQLVMTDQDVVERFAGIVGVGTTKQLASRSSKHRTVYSWGVYNKADAGRVLAMLIEYFGERRKTKAIEGLTRLAYNMGSRSTWTHCRKGHMLTQLSRQRRCLTCKREAAARSYAEGKRIVRQSTI